MAVPMYPCPTCKHHKLIWREAGSSGTAPQGWYCPQCQECYDDEDEIRRKSGAQAESADQKCCTEY